MKNLVLLSLYMLAGLWMSGQSFTRSELATNLEGPWEIVYGPDDHLWISERNGIVSRVNATTGVRQVVYTAPDYFGGDPSERSPFCNNPGIGNGTFGLALHPDFSIPGSSFIYYVYSYDSDTTGTTPTTLFKIVRLTWDPGLGSVVAATDLVTGLPNGYDHLGGRLMAIRRLGTSHLYFTTGDNGKSEANAPNCYVPQSTNPNNFAQDPNTLNGKVHRFNMDGSIPADNPIPGNSFYTRGHRNPQGLMYHSGKDVLFGIEHGDRTDDEINVLRAGMNYGWKDVSGYHHDNNIPGEANFVSAYLPHPGIPNDQLVAPLYTWCATQQPTTSVGGEWCTVAPSDGIYYGETFGITNEIPEWKNSLLVVTLKDGDLVDRGVYQFKLRQDGTSLVPSTPQNPNPKQFFMDDQLVNGRLRDIAIHPWGHKIYLINNGSTGPTDKITVYTHTNATGIAPPLEQQPEIILYPNPAEDILYIKADQSVIEVEIINLMGKSVLDLKGHLSEINTASLRGGIYFAKITTLSGAIVVKQFVRTP